MDSRGSRLVVLVVACLCLVSCTSWRPASVSPPRVIEGEVRITRTDGSEVTMNDPEARPDSIVGVSTAVAVSDVRRLEVLESASGVVTVFLLSVVVLVAVLGQAIEPLGG